ncbi:MAG: glycoside hydrolase family 16 protein [Erysipelotrichia bacterium]|jgi:beta-glucanase (GH16 family)|nr:glycoside hydrolase family 16 protein [Erysipelotrichia bacterium]
MKKSIPLILLLLASACAPKPPVVTPPNNCKSTGYTYDLEDLTYELVWSDEFDVDGEPDPQKWSYDVGGHGWGNQELQYYTKGENVEVKDGKLVIEARKETRGPNAFTSTRLVSKNKGDFRYGKFEVYAKLPDTLGSWSAVWMLPTVNQYGGWPRSGEIDIMEYVVQDLNIVHGTVHTGRYNHIDGTQQGFSRSLHDVSNTFHLYTIEWLPDQIRYYLNGEFVYRFKPSLFITCPTSQHWPFDIPFHLIFNIAVGGSWGGARGVAEEGWPTTMEIDYIRVYQAVEMNDIIENRR